MIKNFDVQTNLSHHNPAKAQSTKEVYAAFFTLNQQIQQTNERKKDTKIIIHQLENQDTSLFQIEI